MTGNEVLDTALDLCGLARGGERGESELREDLKDLQSRSLGLLNLLITELTPLSERVERSTLVPKRLKTLADEVPLPKNVTETLLAYRLAAALIAEEDPELAGALLTYARESRLALLADGKSKTHSITEVYP